MTLPPFAWLVLAWILADLAVVLALAIVADRRDA